MKIFWIGRVAAMLVAPALFAQLNEHCTVSMLNRTAQVKPDGTWHIDNLPFLNGALRARSVCVENGLTVLGQSDLFNVPIGLQVAVDANFSSATTPIPTAMRLTAPVTTLTSLNQTVALTVTGTFVDKSTANLTPASAGTTYLISNSNLATISADGIVTAKATGTVLVQAVNEGAQGLLQLSVVLSGDSDGDGIPDDVEIAQGLDPNNPADALDDPDHDGLNNIEEFRAGTDMHNPDTDGDGLLDGREVKILHTNPLLKDTDADGVPDNIEVATGSDPTDPNSLNLGAALSGIHATPATFALDTGGVTGGGVAFQQLVVTGDFKLGGTINLTARSKGTTYTSSNLSVCNFGAEDGRVFAVANGQCVITIVNSGFTATVSGAVSSSTPHAVSILDFPAGFANGIDVLGNFAYIAAGSAGLVVVNVENAAFPQIVGTVDTPGNANGIRVIGNFAFIADGPGGLQVIDVSNPAAPVLVGSVATPGEALDLTLGGSRVYIASDGSGLAVVDIANPLNPTLLKQIATPGRARGVDLLQSAGGKLFAIVADDIRNPGPPSTAGIRVIDLTDLVTAGIVASVDPGLIDILKIFPQAVRVSGNFAYVVGGGGNVVGNDTGPFVVDLTNPLTPVLKGGFLPNQLLSKDIKIAGKSLIFVDQFDANRAHTLDISDPANPAQLKTIDFGSVVLPAIDFSTSVAAKGAFLFITAGRAGEVGFEKGTSFQNVPTSLIIFQYLPGQDSLGVPPQVTLTEPPANSSVLGGSTIALRATASDDVATASVTFNVNGTDVFTDNSEPFEMLFSVPASATNLTISARAADLGNNVSTSAPTAVTVIADPLTALNGRVTLADGSPVTGAAVTCLKSNAASDASGQFSISGFPVANGEVSCTASFTRNGRQLRGKTAPVPLMAGVTNVGAIAVRDFARVLLIADKPSQTTSSFTNELRGAGDDVTVTPQSTWDNTNPPLANFDCAVHLNGGVTPPLPLQQALVSFVRAGGGYVGFAPNPANDANASSPFHELTLFPGDQNNQGLSNAIETYTKVPGQESHPVTAGLPGSFPVASFETHLTSSSGFFPFTETPPVTILNLSTPAGTPAVAVRQLGSGRVVRFAIGENFQDGAGARLVPDPNLLKLVVNAAGFACGR